MKTKHPFCNLHLLWLMIICLIANSSQANAQAAKSSDYQNHPAWVDMMSDPNVNYYVAVNTYNDFWKGKQKPNDEAETMELQSERNHKDKMTEQEKKKFEKEERERKHEKELDSKKQLTEEDMKQLEWKREMTYQCKRFEDWMRTVKPFVQNDGRILTEEERMKIYDQRQQELKKEKKE